MMEKYNDPINILGKIIISALSVKPAVVVTKKEFRFKEDPNNKDTVDALKVF